MAIYNSERKSVKSIILTSVAALALTMSIGTQAAFAQGEEIKLGTALINLASEADFEILFSPDLVKDHSVVDVQTDGDPQVLLTTLLAGTGLGFEEASPKVFVVKEQNSIVPASVRVPITNNSNAPSAKTVKPSQLAQSASPQTPTSTPANTTPTDGQTGVIEGVVTYSNSGAPLAGAIVYIEGTNQTATTNRRGEYRFSVAPVGRYNLIVDYLGVGSQTGAVEINAGRKSTMNFKMESGLDEIVVTGQRSALMQALNQQRAADNSATVVSSDLIGSFPAETVSEALRRVPGVAFTRDESTGEGTRISVRGFNSEAINVQLNGLDLQGTGIERSVDLSGFLTENISQVTIQKSLLPSHESTGSGGLVEIETKSGLDYGKKYLSLGIERESTLDSGFGKEIQASATGAYQLTDNFGVVASLQYRDTNRDNYDVSYVDIVPPVLPAGFTSLFRVPESFDFPFDPEVDGRLVTGANYSKREREDTNLTGSLNFALDVSDHTNLRLDLQRIESETKQSTPRSTFSFLSSSTDMPVPELGGEVRRRSYLRSLRPTLSLSDIETKLQTTNISLRGETHVDAWDFNYKVGYSKAVTDRKSNSLSFLSNGSTNLVDLINPSTIVTNPDDNAAMTERVVDGGVGVVGDSIPLLNLTADGLAYINDPANYYLSFASLAEARNPTAAYFGELKTRRNFNHKNLEYIEIGGKYNESERANSDDVLSNTTLTAQQSIFRIIGRNTPLSDLYPAGLSFNDLSLIGADGFSAAMLGSWSSADIIAAAQGLVTDDPNTPYNEARFRITDRTGDPIENSGAISPATITEDKLAAYFQTKVKFGDLDVVGGVRYERDNRNGRAISTPILRDATGVSAPRDVLIDAGMITYQDTGGSDDTFSPSLLATYRPNEQTTVRLGYNRSTVNPDIRLLSRPPQLILDLRPAFLKATIREANPDLVPTVTDNFDLDIAHYFKGAPGLIRAGVFYKKTTNNFTSVLLADEAAGPDLRARVLEQLQPLAGTRPDLLDLPADTPLFLNRPQNGEGGVIYGVELEVIRQLDFLGASAPDWLKDFSVVGNVTYTDSDFPTLESARNDDGDQVTLSLDRLSLGTSHWSGNASLRYDNGGLAGSIIYSFQSTSARDYDEFNTNVLIPKFSTLDARLSYTIDRGEGRPQIVLFAEGDDLLKGAKDADIRTAIGSQFGDGNVDFFYPDSLQFSGGRTVTVGARVRF